MTQHRHVPGDRRHRQSQHGVPAAGHDDHDRWRQWWCERRVGVDGDDTRAERDLSAVHIDAVSGYFANLPVEGDTVGRDYGVHRAVDLRHVDVGAPAGLAAKQQAGRQRQRNLAVAAGTRRAVGRDAHTDAAQAAVRVRRSVGERPR